MKVVWFKSDNKHSATINHYASIMRGRVLCGQYIVNFSERVQETEGKVDCIKCSKMAS